MYFPPPLPPGHWGCISLFPDPGPPAATSAFDYLHLLHLPTHGRLLWEERSCFYIGCHLSFECPSSSLACSLSLLIHLPSSFPSFCYTTTPHAFLKPKITLQETHGSRGNARFIHPFQAFAISYKQSLEWLQKSPALFKLSLFVPSPYT